MWFNRSGVNDDRTGREPSASLDEVRDVVRTHRVSCDCPWCEKYVELVFEND